MKRIFSLLILFFPIWASAQVTYNADERTVTSTGGGGTMTVDSIEAGYGLDETANVISVDSSVVMSREQFTTDSAALKLELRTEMGDTTRNQLENLTIGANIAYYADTILVVINDSLHIVYKPRNLAVTATDNGLTTGLLTKGDKNITVTSGSADYIVCLPSTAAADIGTVITGQVGANGFELRTIDAQKATVYINGVTASVEAAIPANSSFEIRCIDATHWILKAWDSVGETLTAIIPDAY